MMHGNEDSGFCFALVNSGLLRRIRFSMKIEDEMNSPVAFRIAVGKKFHGAQERASACPECHVC